MPIIRSPFILTGGGGGGTMPTLNAVTISRNDAVLTITNPATNGNFVENFKIYDDGTLVSTISASQNTFDLTSIASGSHSITVKASASNFNDSADSTAITYTSYSVTNTLTNLTNSNTAISIIPSTAYEGELVANSGQGFYLPENITITIGGNSAEFYYSEFTGEIGIEASEVDGDIVITAVAETTPRLSAPVITLTGSVVSWNAVSNATSYNVYSNDTLLSSTSNTSFDLSSYTLVRVNITVTAIDGANYRESFKSNAEIYGLAPIYGVSGLTASATALTRTDDAVGKTYSMDSTTGVVTSDFDNLFPWNKITIESVSTFDQNAKMVKFPEMWFRVETDEYGLSAIAVSETEGVSGNWYKVDSFYYACYGAKIYNSNTTTILGSISGMTRTYNYGSNNYSRANYRTYARNTGTGFFQLDLYHATVLRFLWLIEFAEKNDRNIGSGLFVGVSGSSSVVTSGGTDFLDNLNAQSGFNTSTKQMRWHYIEDFIGNCYEFVDGFYGSSINYSIYATANPNNFSDSTNNKNLLSYSYYYSTYVNYPVLRSLGWDSNNPFLVFPNRSTNDSTYSTYFAQNSVCNTTPTFTNARVGRGYYSAAGSSNGVFWYDKQTSTSLASYSNTGGRLLYKPTT